MQYVAGLIGNNLGSGRFAGKAILELGSYDINGSVKPLVYGTIPPARYVGVDWRSGPCVDHVSLFHEIQWVGEFDLLISCNALEHDPYWERSIAAGMRALKSGGEIIICVAGPGYPVHEIECAPLPDYYENVRGTRLLEAIRENGGRGILTEFSDPPDVAFHGMKRADAP